MPLTPGARLGHYEVTAKIGEGGMGEVYRVTDTKLNRQVALKILPEAFAADPDGNHWTHFSAFRQWLEKCKTTVVPAASLFNSL